MQFLWADVVHNNWRWCAVMQFIICTRQGYTVIRGLFQYAVRHALIRFLEFKRCGKCAWAITIYRVDSTFASIQWETVLLCNDVPHLLGARLRSALMYLLIHLQFMVVFKSYVQQEVLKWLHRSHIPCENIKLFLQNFFLGTKIWVFEYRNYGESCLIKMLLFLYNIITLTTLSSLKVLKAIILRVINPVVDDNSQ